MRRPQERSTKSANGPVPRPSGQPPRTPRGPACEERPEHHMHGQGVPCSMLPPGIHRGTPGRIHENAHRGSQGQHEYARHQQQRPVPPALRRSAELHEHRRNPSANAPDLFRPSANPFGKTREKRPPLPRHDGEQHDRGEHARPRDEDEQQAPSEPETSAASRSSLARSSPHRSATRLPISSSMPSRSASSLERSRRSLASPSASSASRRSMRLQRSSLAAHSLSLRLASFSFLLVSLSSESCLLSL